MIDYISQLSIFKICVGSSSKRHANASEVGGVTRIFLWNVNKKCSYMTIILICRMASAKKAAVKRLGCDNVLLHAIAFYESLHWFTHYTLHYACPYP